LCCPERVWGTRARLELGAAGVAYTAVDDAHFRGGGVRAESLATFLTEIRAAA
jgi:hypothetical protein